MHNKFFNKKEPSDYLLNSLKQSEKDREKGDYYSFADDKKALAFLDNIIDGKR